MANNAYVNKVQLANGTVLIDISDTTAAASDVAAGKVFYTAAGVPTTGTATVGGSTVYYQDTLDAAGGTIRTITTDDQIEVTSLSVNASGTYIAPSSVVYNSVTVNVPLISKLTFDFTKSLTDEETGFFTFILNNGTRDSNGLHLTQGTSNAILQNISLNNKVVKIQTGSMQKTYSSGHGRFYITNSAGDRGLIYRSSGSWQIYNGAWTQTMDSDPTYFANSTLTFIYGESGNTVTLYKDNTKIFENMDIGGNQTIYLGSTSQAFYDATILSLTIMTTEQYALEILMGNE